MNLYLKTLIITIIVFSFGIFIVLNIEGMFLSVFLLVMSSIENDVRNMELEMLYFQEMSGNESCVFLNEMVRRTNNKLDELSSELLSYREDNIIFTKSKITNLKQTYTYFLIKDWILQEKVKDECETDTVSVLYFYKIDECDKCIIQGDILSLLKDKFKNKLMIFPLDINVDLGMMKVLMSNFNVTTVPSLVIDGEVYTDVTKRNALEYTICSKISDELCVNV